MKKSVLLLSLAVMLMVMMVSCNPDYKGPLHAQTSAKTI